MTPTPALPIDRLPGQPTRPRVLSEVFSGGLGAVTVDISQEETNQRDLPEEAKELTGRFGR